jgi:RimJ/RimL family protein N-acetyltransferase
LWGFGTDAYRDAAPAVTRHIKRDMIPTLVSQGVHRGQCVVHPNNHVSQRWLHALGFIREATLSGFGSRREDMLLYAWVADAPTPNH